MSRLFSISPLNQQLRQVLQEKIDSKTKPPGSLGLLESIALQVGLVQQSLEPALKTPQLVLFAADHGVATAGVSAYPQDVTRQMVMNFVSGGAAINVFCKQNSIGLEIVDAGVVGNMDVPGVVNEKIAEGTQSFVDNVAMTEEQFFRAVSVGSRIVKAKAEAGCNVIGFGEMGIGNTSSAAVINSVLCALPLENAVGRGTGLDDEGLQHKLDVLGKALEYHQCDADPEKVMQCFGGFELAMIYGAALQAAECGMIVLVDGYISSAAVLAAIKSEPLLKDYCIFCHCSEESGHRLMLEHLGVSPLLDLGLRLGEGSGVALAWPLIQSAVAFLNEMASFESAGVSERSE
jgi:nicotinate-nucleotide--dimethylbenzimidazole phosphoribosyltransferase